MFLENISHALYHAVFSKMKICNVTHDCFQLSLRDQSGYISVRDLGAAVALSTHALVGVTQLKVGFCVVSVPVSVRFFPLSCLNICMD